MNSPFLGCWSYLNPDTQITDFSISLEAEMDNMEPVNEVATGCIASRRSPDAPSLDFTSSLTFEVTADPNVANIRALRRDISPITDTIVAELQPSGESQFSSANWPPFDIPVPIGKAACDCESLERQFGMADPVTLTNNSLAIAAVPDVVLDPALGEFSTGAVSTPRVTRDARFFGTYCQMDPQEVCREISTDVFGFFESSRTVCEDLQNTRLSLDYIESIDGHSLYGLGSFLINGNQSPFAAAGLVVDAGAADLVVNLPRDAGVAQGQRNLRLVEVPVRGQGIDHRLIIDVYNETLVLSKQACGNAVPDVSIESLSGSNLIWGENHCFVGRVLADEDAAFPQDRMTLTSSRDRDLTPPQTNVSSAQPLQVTRCTSALSPGEHEIIFRAVDSGGLINTASTAVTVSNQPPRAPRIVQPRPGDTLVAEGEVVFQGKALDSEEGMLSGLALNWFASIEDEPFFWLGAGSQLTSAFPSAGNWQVRLEAKDSLGESSEVTSKFFVQPNNGNTPPRTTIWVPPHLTVPGPMAGSFTPGDVTFRGTAYDTEDATGDLTLRWDAKPIFPEGPALPSVVDTTLAVFALEASDSRRVYEITFSAEDTGGLVGQSVIRVVVWPP